MVVKVFLENAKLNQPSDDEIHNVLRFPLRPSLIRHSYDERRSCFRSAPLLSVVAVTTPQFMPGILR